MTPMQANAQNQVIQNQDGQNVVQTDTMRNYNSLGDVLRHKGWSENDVKSLSKQVNPANIMARNSKGEGNKPIYDFLSSMNNLSSSMSTNNIKIFGANEYNIQSNYLSKFNEETASKYKLFMLKGGGTVLMPINYTIQDVQRELQDDTFQLGDFDI